MRADASGERMGRRIHRHGQDRSCEPRCATARLGICSSPLASPGQCVPPPPSQRFACERGHLPVDRVDLGAALRSLPHRLIDKRPQRRRGVPPCASSHLQCRGSSVISRLGWRRPAAKGRPVGVRRWSGPRREWVQDGGAGRRGRIGEGGPPWPKAGPSVLGSGIPKCLLTS
jgi:hypothetical protein